MNRISFLHHASIRSLLMGTALFLFVLQLVFEVWVWSPMQEQRDRLTMSVLRRSRAPSNDIQSPSAPAQRIEYFSQALQQMPHESERLIKWHALATKHAIRIKNINYKESLEFPVLQKTLMQAELEASYPAIRSFIRDVLEHDLATGLESMSIAQATGNASGLKVQLHFAIYSHASSRNPLNGTH
jgi:Tfp pilus assembly protein PilO